MNNFWPLISFAEDEEVASIALRRLLRSMKKMPSPWAMILTTLVLLSAAMLTLTSCSSTSEPPPDVGKGRFTYTEGVPGGVLVQTVKISATVTAIDRATREATIIEPNGLTFMMKVSPEAVNFDQVNVGDQITATVTEKIVASLAKEGTTSDDATLAPKGDKPAGLTAETTPITATVLAVDPDKRTVTLQFDEGEIKTLPVYNDADLSQVKVGQQAVFRVTEMVALWIEKQP